MIYFHKPMMTFEQLAPVESLAAIPRHEPLELEAGAVDLWCFAYEEPIADAALRAEYDALMTPDERERQRRYYFEKDRRLFLATRALVRTTLSRYAPIAPAEWRFEANEHGKPAAVEVDNPLWFNLSNTRGLVVCAVSSCHAELGVDVENVERRAETVAIADRFFSPAEVEALRAQPQDQQKERFFHYWTLKESYIKARGLGLAIPLALFSFELDVGREIGISFDPELGDDPQHWQFALLRASARHVVAVGVDCRPEALRLRWAPVVPLRRRW